MSVIMLNGEKQSLSIPDGIPVTEILEHHLGECIPADQVVCEVHVDGGAVELPEARWGQFDRMVVRTGPPSELVVQGLVESSEVVRDISARMVMSAARLREGNTQGFKPLFVSAIDDLLAFLHFLSLSQVYMGAKEAVMEQFQVNLKERVELMLKAQEQQDMVLLADLLEYELVPLFEGWEGVKSALMKTLEPEAVDG